MESSFTSSREPSFCKYPVKIPWYGLLLSLKFFCFGRMTNEREFFHCPSKKIPFSFEAMSMVSVSVETCACRFPFSKAIRICGTVAPAENEQRQSVHRRILKYRMEISIQ